MLERIGDSLGHADLVFKCVGGFEAELTAQHRSRERPVRALHPSAALLSVRLAHQSARREEAVRPCSDRVLPRRYNPVLGEFFRCRYDYANGTCAYYIAEQVSHHPPISCVG